MRLRPTSSFCDEHVLSTYFVMLLSSYIVSQN